MPRIPYPSPTDITPENAASILRTTRAGQIHLTARRNHESPMTFRRPEIPMGAGAVPGEYEIQTADPVILRQLLDSL